MCWRNRGQVCVALSTMISNGLSMAYTGNFPDKSRCDIYTRTHTRVTFVQFIGERGAKCAAGARGGVFQSPRKYSPIFTPPPPPLQPFQISCHVYSSRSSIFATMISRAPPTPSHSSPPPLVGAPRLTFAFYRYYMLNLFQDPSTHTLAMQLAHTFDQRRIVADLQAAT